MSLSDTTELKLLEHLIGKNAWTMPAVVAVALATANPADPASGTSFNEVPNSNNYSRVTTSGADWESAAAGAIQNQNAITFPQASGSWGTVTHFAIVTSATWGQGEILAYGALGASKAVGANDTPSFAAGDLDLTAD